MNKIQEFMLKHPYVSLAAILPFAFTIVMGLFSIILNIVLPINRPSGHYVSRNISSGSSSSSSGNNSSGGISNNGSGGSSSIGSRDRIGNRSSRQ